MVRTSYTLCMRVSEVLLTNILLLLHERNRCLSSLDPEESTSPHECKAFNFVGYYSFVLVILRSRSMRRIYIDTNSSLDDGAIISCFPRSRDSLVETVLWSVVVIVTISW